MTRQFRTTINPKGGLYRDFPFVTPVLAAGGMPEGFGAGTSGANVATGMRVVIPRTGRLRDLAVYVGTASGNVDIGVYDTAATTRTRLYHSGAVACPAANAWQIIGDPNLAVEAGDHVDFAFACDNATAQFGRYSLVANQLQLLPTALFTSPSGGAAKMAWQIAASYQLPTPLTEANLLTNANNVAIWVIGRIS